VAIVEGEKERVVEFISWNPVTAAFDFGKIDHSKDQRKVSFAHEPTCFSCHRTRSPIFPNEAWDNTVINRSVLAAFIENQAEASTQDFQDLNAKFQDVLEKDRLARTQNPPNVDDFIDYQMQEDEVFRQATYNGFPFIDATTEQAFDFNQAIFDAHALIVATDWLQTLPYQPDAAKIANEKAIDLIEEYSSHYKSLVTLKSPYLLNYNLIAKQVNSFHSLDEVIPSKEHVQAVHDYNALASNRGEHLIALMHKPTSPEAFEHHHVDWRDYLTKEILSRAYKEDDPSYRPREMHYSDKVRFVPHDKLCSSCHSGESGSPRPDFSSFNPLKEEAWAKRLKENFEAEGQLLCKTLARISSLKAPMPPKQTREAKSFVTYRHSAILSLQTLVERHGLECL